MGFLSFVDAIAERLLELRAVSPAQWLLRGGGVLATAAAALAAMPAGPAGNLFAVLAVIVIPVTVLVQVFRPDTTVGVLAPATIVVTLVAQPELTIWRAGGVGLLLLAAHVAWALAATAPAHGEFATSAWLLAGRWALLAFAASAAGGIVVLALAGVDLGSWMVVLGVLAVIGLILLALPRDPDRT